MYHRIFNKSQISNVIEIVSKSKVLIRISTLVGINSRDEFDLKEMYEHRDDFEYLLPK